MNEEILAKLKEAKSAEEILAIAKEDGKEVTAEQAKELYHKSDKPPVHREVSVDGAIFILQRQGCLVTAPNPA